jgi:predicted phosphoribosyltransferase
MQAYGQDAPFRDRCDAGRQLARQLAGYASQPGLLVLALPSGGVPVAYEVARALDAELDVFLVRKLVVPGHAELEMGVIASGGIRVLNEAVVQAFRIAPATIDAVAAAERDTLDRRERFYRGVGPRSTVRDRSVILIDDGLTTGSTWRAALEALGHEEPKRLVAAVPVAPRETCEQLEAEADEVVCAAVSSTPRSTTEWYRDLTQTTDEEVRTLLGRLARSQPAVGRPH